MDRRRAYFSTFRPQGELRQNNKVICAASHRPVLRAVGCGEDWLLVNNAACVEPGAFGFWKMREAP